MRLILVRVVLPSSVASDSTVTIAWVWDASMAGQAVVVVIYGSNTLTTGCLISLANNLS